MVDSVKSNNNNDFFQISSAPQELQNDLNRFDLVADDGNFCVDGQADGVLSWGSDLDEKSLIVLNMQLLPRGYQLIFNTDKSPILTLVGESEMLPLAKFEPCSWQFDRSDFPGVSRDLWHLFASDDDSIQITLPPTLDRTDSVQLSRYLEGWVEARVTNKNFEKVVFAEPELVTYFFAPLAQKLEGKYMQQQFSQIELQVPIGLLLSNNFTIDHSGNLLLPTATKQNHRLVYMLVDEAELEVLQQRARALWQENPDVLFLDLNSRRSDYGAYQDREVSLWSADEASPLRKASGVLQGTQTDEECDEKITMPPLVITDLFVTIGEAQEPSEWTTAVNLGVELLPPLLLVVGYVTKRPQIVAKVASLEQVEVASRVPGAVQKFSEAEFFSHPVPLGQLAGQQPQAQPVYPGKTVDRVSLAWWMPQPLDVLPGDTQTYSYTQLDPDASRTLGVGAPLVFLGRNVDDVDKGMILAPVDATQARAATLLSKMRDEHYQVTTFDINELVDGSQNQNPQIADAYLGTLAHAVLKAPVLVNGRVVDAFCSAMGANPNPQMKIISAEALAALAVRNVKFVFCQTVIDAVSTVLVTDSSAPEECQVFCAKILNTHINKNGGDDNLIGEGVVRSLVYVAEKVRNPVVSFNAIASLARISGVAVDKLSSQFDSVSQIAQKGMYSTLPDVRQNCSVLLANLVDARPESFIAKQLLPAVRRGMAVGNNTQTLINCTSVYVSLAQYRPNILTREDLDIIRAGLLSPVLEVATNCAMAYRSLAMNDRSRFDHDDLQALGSGTRSTEEQVRVPCYEALAIITGGEDQ